LIVVSTVPNFSRLKDKFSDLYKASFGEMKTRLYFEAVKTGPARPEGPEPERQQVEIKSKEA
jgi:hypothetical protein